MQIDTYSSTKLCAMIRAYTKAKRDTDQLADRITQSLAECLQEHPEPEKLRAFLLGQPFEMLGIIIPNELVPSLTNHCPQGA